MAKNGISCHKRPQVIRDLIDIEGKTTYYTKTTYDPDGIIVHVKEKFPKLQTIYPNRE
ncbi:MULTISPECIES: hypothetical protein [Spirulina sp. CCY15215]|uniref:hypothetical protein n=1 Tax=Spirulina sp. CCY15215 TaxID=2767591 RepID=UPI001951BB03|nr:hypothetical protein [Spirulina major]